MRLFAELFRLLSLLLLFLFNSIAGFQVFFEYLQVQVIISVFLSPFFTSQTTGQHKITCQTDHCPFKIIN